MNILVTGTSSGIGKAIAEKFLNENHKVYGIDINSSTIINKNYTHFKQSIEDKNYPQIDSLDILVNNDGIQEGENVIDINLKAVINLTENYIHKSIKSIVFIASSSATTGSEFPEYVASKGGVVAYMKNVALRISKYGATANSISPGGVITPLNNHILNDEHLYNLVLLEIKIYFIKIKDNVINIIFYLLIEL